jgi:hypothetical protein
MFVYFMLLFNGAHYHDIMIILYYDYIMLILKRVIKSVDSKCLFYFRFLGYYNLCFIFG